MCEKDITKNRDLTLISFLGSGKYEEVTYYLEGHKIISNLSIYPIIQTYGPQKIYVIGTKDSNWALLQGIEYRKIEIPSGRDEKELWEIFGLTVEGLDQLENTSVIFDITHCFRSIPFFAVLLAKFLRFIKKSVDIQNIFYGFLDNQTKESRIVDLAPLLELLDLIDGLNSLEKYGDLKDISRLLEIKQRKLRQNFPASLSRIKKILDRLTAITEMTYIPQLNEIAENLDSSLQDKALLDDIRLHFKPLFYLIPRLQELATRFKVTPAWKAQLEISRWYNENRHPSQALLVLREAIITYICSKKNLDPYDNNQRNEIERELNDNRTNPRNKIDQLWDKIIQLRNKTAHALMNKNINIDPSKARDRVDELIKEAEELLNRESR